MEALKARAFEVFDLLSKQKQNLVYELIINLVSDDVAMPDDIAARHAAMEEYWQGKTVSHEDIDWD
jgi:hypothetical protein